MKTTLEDPSPCLYRLFLSGVGYLDGIIRPQLPQIRILVTQLFLAEPYATSPRKKDATGRIGTDQTGDLRH